MSTGVKKEDSGLNDFIKIKQYIIDVEGQTVAAIIDVEELKRLEQLIRDINEIIEDISSISAVEERKNEPEEDYKAYSDKRKSQLNVQLKY
ncbi:MAG: hypothetical protein E3K32_11110 [wastewater metagenome]|nr:hypothetical protein [Candidatus Loosdrechtia aerotolerans]